MIRKRTEEDFLLSHRSPSSVRLAAGSALGLALTVVAQPTFAQDNDGEYWLARKNQIVVTATRVVTKPEEVPSTVPLKADEQIAGELVSDIHDLVRAACSSAENEFRETAILAGRSGDWSRMAALARIVSDPANGHRVDLTAFSARYKDFISPEVVSGSFTPTDPAVHQFINLDRVRVKGAEARFEGRASSGLFATLALSYAKGNQIDPDGVRTPLSRIDLVKIVAGVGYREPAGRFGGHVII